MKISIISLFSIVANSLLIFYFRYSFIIESSGYREVRESLRGSNVMLTTGEHEYSRYGFKQLIDSRCVDIIQPDITWLGG